MITIRLVIIASVLSVLHLIPAFGQHNEFGIKGGLNLANLSETSADNQDYNPGLHGGLAVKVFLAGDMSLQTEILYSRKGSIIDYEEEFLGVDIVNGETRFAFDYIDIPFYLLYEPVNNVNIHAGPYIGLLMDAKVDTDVEIVDILQLDPEEDIDTDYFYGTDYGLGIGAAYQYNKLRFGINYLLGLRQLAKTEDVAESLIGDARNRTLQLYIGVMLWQTDNH